MGEGGAAVGEGGAGLGVGDGGVGVMVAVGEGVCSGVDVYEGVGRAVLVGSDRMDTSLAPSPGLSSAGQAARRKTAAASAAMAPARRIAISRRFYRKGGRRASLL